MTERWRKIGMADNRYEVSDSGRIRRCAPHIRSFVGRVIATEKAKRGGHLRVRLYVDGREIKAGVHRLVAEAFRGPPPSPHHEVRHLDGNPENNCLPNVVWGTRAQNAQDRSAHGNGIGETHPRARLSEADVRRIRATPMTRGVAKQFASELGVAREHISRVANRHAWRHIT